MDERDVVKAARDIGGRVESAFNDDVAPAARHAMNKAVSATADAAETAGDLAEDALRQGDALRRRAVRTLERNVDQSPMATLALVAVASFALGYALRASSDK